MLSELMHNMFQASEMSAVVAVATDYRERSHFDGQDILERGRLSAQGDDGWLNRAFG